MTTRWRKVNGRVFYSVLKKEQESFSRRLIPILYQAADMTVKEIEQSYGDITPYKTGNLQDSTGVGIYKDGALVAYAKPLPSAVEAQRYHGRTVNGDVELQQAFSEGYENFPEGIWGILISAVPYATHLQKDEGYFDTVSAIFRENVSSLLRQNFGELFVLV